MYNCLFEGIVRIDFFPEPDIFADGRIEWKFMAGGDCRLAPQGANEQTPEGLAEGRGGQPGRGMDESLGHYLKMELKFMVGAAFSLLMFISQERDQRNMYINLLIEIWEWRCIPR